MNSFLVMFKKNSSRLTLKKTLKTNPDHSIEKSTASMVVDFLFIDNCVNVCVECALFLVGGNEIVFYLLKQICRKHKVV